MNKTLRQVTGQPNNKRKVSAYLDNRYYRTVEQQAQATGTTSADIIRRAVVMYCKQN